MVNVNFLPVIGPIIKGFRFVGPVYTGGELVYNLVSGKSDPIPAPQQDPVTEANNAVQNVVAEAAADAGQAVKEAGENAFNTLSGGFDTVKKYAGVAVAGIAGLILLGALKK